MGAVDFERFFFWYPGGSCLQSTYIRSMAQFGLCVASDDFVFLCGFEEEFMLFWCTLVSKGSLESVSYSSLMIRKIGERARNIDICNP